MNFKYIHIKRIWSDKGERYPASIAKTGNYVSSGKKAPVSKGPSVNRERELTIPKHRTITNRQRFYKSKTVMNNIDSRTSRWNKAGI